MTAFWQGRCPIRNRDTSILLTGASIVMSEGSTGRVPLWCYFAPVDREYILGIRQSSSVWRGACISTDNEKTIWDLVLA